MLDPEQKGLEQEKIPSDLGTLSEIWVKDQIFKQKIVLSSLSVRFQYGYQIVYLLSTHLPVICLSVAMATDTFSYKYW